MAALCVANLAGGMVYFFCQVIQILMYAYGQNERIFFTFKGMRVLLSTCI